MAIDSYTTEELEAHFRGYVALRKRANRLWMEGPSEAFEDTMDRLHKLARHLVDGTGWAPDYDELKRRYLAAIGD